MALLSNQSIPHWSEPRHRPRDSTGTVKNDEPEAAARKTRWPRFDFGLVMIETQIILADEDPA